MGEVMAEAEEAEAMVEAGAAVAAEGMIVDTTADRIGTVDQHQSKKAKRSTLQSTLWASEGME